MAGQHDESFGVALAFGENEALCDEADNLQRALAEAAQALADVTESLRFWGDWADPYSREKYSFEDDLAEVTRAARKAKVASGLPDGLF